MFDFFRNNDNSDRRDNIDEPRIIFANLRRRSGPILSPQGYKSFTFTTFTAWAFVVFAVWVFRIEVTPSQNVVNAIAGSSVELAALTLAVLGLLHELNKEDKWFKLGLFLVALIFVCVVLGGFFLSLTWKDEFNAPQSITIYFFFVLGFVATTQFVWRGTIQLALIHRILRVIPTRITIALQQITLGVPFVIPILFIGLPGLNRVSAVILLFIGGVIALAILMGVTTISLFNKLEEDVDEDPFLTVLKTRYETEIETIMRLGELKSITLTALARLQERAVKTGRNKPVPVQQNSLIASMRTFGVKESTQSLRQVFSFLVERGIICTPSYSGPYWIVPDEPTIEQAVDVLNEIYLLFSPEFKIRTQEDEYQADYLFEGYYFTELRNRAACRAKLPCFVVDEFVMPRLLSRLSDGDYFKIIPRTVYKDYKIFVNRTKSPPESLMRSLHEFREKGKKIERKRYRTGFSSPFGNELQRFFNFRMKSLSEEGDEIGQFIAANPALLDEIIAVYS